ncbi:MAG: Gfo/Idh/MocA family protein [Planctomycetota bacterium]
MRRTAILVSLLVGGIAAQGPKLPLFRDAVSTSLPAGPGYSVDAAFGDADGDEDVDLVIGRLELARVKGQNLLLRGFRTSGSPPWIPGWPDNIRPMTENRKVAVGIVGAGFLADIRGRCYGALPGASVLAVVARSRASAEGWASRHGKVRVCAELEELLALGEIDVVDLCVPNHLHRSMAAAAAAAGKHVICTKPLTAYVGQDLEDGASDADVASCDRRTMLRVATADAVALLDAARAGGVRLMYGESWVYAPSIARARDLLETAGGAVLEVRGWEGHNGSHSPYSKVWRYGGGGALLRLGTHPLGAMIHLKRQEGLARDGKAIRPVSVTAELGELSQNPSLDEGNTFIATGWKDVENWGCAILRFEDGSRGVAYGSDNVLGGMESKLEIMASNCHFKCNLSPNDMLRAYAPDNRVFGDAYLMEKVDSKAGWSTPMPSEDWCSGHLAMLADFVDAVAEDRPPLSDGTLGLEVTRVIYGAYLSAAEGRRIELH